jgi:hypothetical protein
VAKAFGLNLAPDVPWTAKIAGYSSIVHLSPPESHFPQVNLLGVDFCNQHGLISEVVKGDRIVKYYLGQRWKVTQF